MSVILFEANRPFKDGELFLSTFLSRLHASKLLPSGGGRDSSSWEETGNPQDILRTFLVSLVEAQHKGLVFLVKITFPYCICHFACHEKTSALILDSSGKITESLYEASLIKLFVDLVGMAEYTETKRRVLKEIGQSEPAKTGPDFQVRFQARVRPGHRSAFVDMFDLSPDLYQGKTEEISWTVPSSDSAFRDLDKILSSGVNIDYHLLVFPDGAALPRAFVSFGGARYQMFCDYRGQALSADTTSRTFDEALQQFNKDYESDLLILSKQKPSSKIRRAPTAALSFSGNFLYGDYVLLYPEGHEGEGVFFPKHLVEFDDQGTVLVRGWLSEHL